MDPLQVVVCAAARPTSVAPGWIDRVLRSVVVGWLFMDHGPFPSVCARYVAIPAERAALAGAPPRRAAPARAGRHRASAAAICPSALSTPRDETLRGRSTAASRRATCRRVLRGLRHVDRAGRRRPRHDPRAAARGLQRRDPPGRDAVARCTRTAATYLARSSWPDATSRPSKTPEAGPIVVNSAGCGAMLKDYAHQLRADPAWAERARAFSARVRDLSRASGRQPPDTDEKRDRTDGSSTRTRVTWSRPSASVASRVTLLRPDSRTWSWSSCASRTCAAAAPASTT